MNPLCNVIPFGFDRIWNYGCWCNFGEDLLDGRHQPVNIFDSICKDFQLCLRCAKLDDDSCDPANQTYQTGGITNNHVSQCQVQNSGNECATNVCICEQTIIVEIMDLAFLPFDPVNEYSDEFLHSNGWSFEDNCPRILNAEYSGKNCCGNFPKRFPYSVGNSKKECCRDLNLYNPAMQDCCLDGSVGDIGSC